jgi:hypothetical protein
LNAGSFGLELCQFVTLPGPVEVLFQLLPFFLEFFLFALDADQLIQGVAFSQILGAFCSVFPLTFRQQSAGFFANVIESLHHLLHPVFVLPCAKTGGRDLVLFQHALESECQGERGTGQFMQVPLKSFDVLPYLKDIFSQLRFTFVRLPILPFVECARGRGALEFLKRLVGVVQLEILRDIRAKVRVINPRSFSGHIF